MRLPSPEPEHKVMAVSSVIPGYKIRAKDVEMVFNDAALIDFVEGAGSYRASYQIRIESPLGDAKRQLQIEVLDVAERLYGRSPSWPTN